MSNCINNCKLCNNLVISRSVTFANNQLTIDLPSGNYLNNGRYCIVIAQTIPTTVTIATPVVFTINGGTTVFDFLNKDCTPIYASQLRTEALEYMMDSVVCFIEELQESVDGQEGIDIIKKYARKIKEL